MRRKFCAIAAVFAILTSTTVVRAAEYNTQPLLTFNNYREVHQATYSSIGRYMQGETKYFSYGTREFTDYSEAVPADGEGIPIVISVSDPDDGQILRGKVLVQGMSYNIHWKSLDGILDGETGKKITGFAFIPIVDLSNTHPGGDTLTIIVDNYENAGDAVSVATVSTSATIMIDRQAPTASITASNNIISVNSISELPCKLMVQMKDELNNWNPAVETMITGCPTVFEYDSLWHPGVSVRYWVEDMLGNRSIDAEDDLSTPNDKIVYTGHHEDNRATYAAYINIRLGNEERLNERYFTFVGGLL